MNIRNFLSSLAGAGMRVSVPATLLVTAWVGQVSPAAAATIAFDLCATTGSVSVPGGSVPAWGYALGDCSGSPVATVPGPVLTVDAGDVVTITLHNNLPLSEPTSLLLQGQSIPPDLAGAPSGGTQSYSFTAANPGAFLYEAGLLPNSQHQVAMGMYGALIVHPATAGRAYDDPSTAYDSAHVLVLSELDPVLNNSANPASFDLRNYAPQYFLINGQAYPDTTALAVAAGDKVLLRYINAGLETHAMSTLGLSQTLIAQDGYPYALSHDVVAESIQTGQTLDSLVTIPASGATTYAVYDANLTPLRNNSGTGSNSGLGGMLTFLDAGAGSTGSGPLTSQVLASPNPTNGSVAVAINASVSDATTGNDNITAAEYFIDVIGTDGGGNSMNGTFNSSPTLAVDATISTTTLAGLSSGNHAIYVHGMDAASNWGPVASFVLNLDKAGPVTSALTLTPNPTNGTSDVSLTASASDVATGNSDIVAAEYSIDGGTAVSMAVNNTAPIAGLSATISAATINSLSSGPHIVSVRSRDSLDNWGAPASITLNADLGSPDTAGPVTSGLSASPNPNNGTIPFNTSVPAVRVTATFSDATTGNSKVTNAEGFLDQPGTIGTGFVFIANDGSFDSVTESGYGDIPLASLISLSDGDHPICVHGKDAAGNWGTFDCGYSLTIDKTAPVISSATLTPNTIPFAAASVTLNVSASDGSGTGVTGGTYAIDNGTAVSFNGSSAVIPTSTVPAGSHTVQVRILDAVGNVATTNLSLWIVQAVNDNPGPFTANTSFTQNADVSAANGLLANDQPLGLAGRSVRILSAPIRIAGSGAGTIAVSCQAGTAATPSISGNTVCTNGAYRITLRSVFSLFGSTRRASKRGTYQFSYEETLNGVTSNASVTIQVN